MAFVYSILTDEEKNNLNRKYRLSNPHKKEKEADLYSKVYDKDSNATLLQIIGMLHKPAVFAFIFQDFVCIINARYVDKSMEKSMIRYWTLERVYIPKPLESQKEYVLLLIKESFEMMGKPAHRNNSIVESIVKVDFDNNECWY